MEKVNILIKYVPHGIRISLISGKNVSETPKISDIYARIVIFSLSLAIFGWKIPIHDKELNSGGFKLSSITQNNENTSRIFKLLTELHKYLQKVIAKKIAIIFWLLKLLNDQYSNVSTKLQLESSHYFSNFKVVDRYTQLSPQIYS